MSLSFTLFLGCLAPLILAAPAQARRKSVRPAKVDWGTVARPSKQTPEVFGSYANGCLAGAEALPEGGDGFRSIRRHRNRFYGHPALVAFLKLYAADAMAAGLPTLFVGDLSQPRGGRMPTGHTSHRVGLDADIWFTQPPEVTPEGDECFPSLVDAKAETINRAVYAPEHVAMIQRAATSPQVARVFVSWLIKRELCATITGDRSWLGKVRPWFGHDRHFHIRLACPADSPQCVNQAPAPTADGCGQEAYFARAAVIRRRKHPEPAPKRPVTVRAPFPRQCQAVLAAPAF